VITHKNLSCRDKINFMRKIKILLLLFVLCVATNSFAQLSEAEDKQVNKALKLFNKGKHDKGIATLDKVQKNNLQNEDLWRYRVQMEYSRYIVQLNKDLETAEKKYGGSKREQNNFLDKSKSSGYEIEMLAAASRATLHCEKQELASIIIRIFMVDETNDRPDKEAKEEYAKGEEKFKAEDYTGAIRHYKKAVEIDSTYYKATLYLGDAYFHNEDFDKAITWYQKACDMRPNLLEPRKYLTDGYIKQKKWSEAYAACIDGIAVYPDVGMFIKLEDICDKQGKSFDRHWVSRLFYPNTLNFVQDPIETSPWSHYRKAKSEIQYFCNQRGIITDKNDKTEAKYMEVYSWEYMLENGEGAELSFARKMKEAGFLDCYVFISMYHISIQPQFEKWNPENKERIRTYVDTYLVK